MSKEYTGMKLGSAKRETVGRAGGQGNGWDYELPEHRRSLAGKHLPSHTIVSRFTVDDIVTQLAS